MLQWKCCECALVENESIDNKKNRKFHTFNQTFYEQMIACAHNTKQTSARDGVTK